MIEAKIIDAKTVAYELEQARRARLEAELAGREVEELAEGLRRAQPGWPAPLRLLPQLFVFSA